MSSSADDPLIVWLVRGTMQMEMEMEMPPAPFLFLPFSVSFTSKAAVALHSHVFSILQGVALACLHTLRCVPCVLRL